MIRDITLYIVLFILSLGLVVGLSIAGHVPLQQGRLKKPETFRLLGKIVKIDAVQPQK